MRTFSRIKGLPVYNGYAEILGHVADLCISPDGSLLGLIMDGKGIFHRDRFIPLSSIHALGENGVMLNSQGKLLSLHEMKASYTYNTYDTLRYKTVLTKEGQKLGLLEDVYVSEKMGTIEAYELTDGFFADIAEGKKVVKTAGEPLTISKDAIVIDY